MSDTAVLDVAAALAHQGVNRFLLRVLGVSALIAFFDGFDQNVISFAAPTIAPALGLDPTMIGNIFAMGNVGSMLGGFLFGALGDRLGRRPTAILAALMFSTLTLTVALASSYESMLLVRFAVGIGTGGLLPVCWALNVEYAPKRFRSSIVTLVMLGYSAGASLGGPAVICLVPNFGWQSVFVIGGVLSLLATGALIALLPESVRFLTARDRDHAGIRHILGQVAPAVPVPDGARFVLGDEESKPKRLSPALLFEGTLRWVTPMLWLATMFSSVATFFLTSWTPLVFHALAFPSAEAAAAGSITAIAGAIGGLALMRFTDRHGAIAVAAMPLLAIPLLLIGGLVDVGSAGLLILVAAIAFALIGGHLGMNSLAGIYYPSALRATGAGWATAVGKIGSIAGPLLAGIILATGLPTRNIFAVAGLCPALMLVCLAVLGRIQHGVTSRKA